VPVTFTNNSAKFLADIPPASNKAIIACANLLVRRLKKAFGPGYYKGGAFRDTLKVKASIQREDAPKLGRDGYEIRVGSKFGKPQEKAAGVKRGNAWMVPLYWELGHYNIFTRRYERNEIFRPTAVDATPALSAEYARVFMRYMNKWRAP